MVGKQARFFLYSLLVADLLLFLTRPASIPGSIRLVFLGDVMLGRGVSQAHTAGDWPQAFQALQPVISSADLALANLESPITTSPAYHW